MGVSLVHRTHVPNDGGRVETVRHKPFAFRVEGEQTNHGWWDPTLPKELTTPKTPTGKGP